VIASALAQPVKFDRISLEQGLSQSTVNCILQDRYGFMWFGTQDGLNRYDGFTFTVYRHRADDPSSLSTNFVWALSEDKDGALWIATDGGGLDRFERDTGKFVHYQAGPTSESLTTNFVRVVYQDHAGVLWAGTDGGGLNKFDRSTEHFTRYLHNPSNPDSLSNNTIRAIYEDRQGGLWIGTDGGGLDRFDRATERFAHYRHDPNNPDSLGDDAVWAIYEDRQGALWIGTNGGGLDRFDRATGRFTHYRHNPVVAPSLGGDSIRTILEDSTGRLWIGMNGGGLDLVHRDGEQIIHYRNDLSDAHSLGDNTVLSIYEDRGGVLWVGTANGGLSKADRAADAFVHYQAKPNEPNSLSQNMVWSIYQDRGGIVWIGTTGGLDRLDRSTGQFTHYAHDPARPDSLANGVVYAIREDGQGMLWLGMDAGQVDQFDRATGRLTHYRINPTGPSRSQERIISIREDHEGALLFGASGGGLQQLNRATGHLVPYQSEGCHACLRNDYVRVVYEDRAGSLWIGTAGAGLVKLDRSAERVVRYAARPNDPAGLSHGTVQSILEDRSGVLWVGTSGGFNRFDPSTETFTQFTEKDGLPNDMVYGILEAEQGYLWLSTNKGLARFDPRAQTFAAYDVSDGLQSNEFNSGAFYQGVNGEMFFGGVNGFNAFFPERVGQKDTYPPPVVLTSLTQDGQPLGRGQSVESLQAITLRWPRNTFEFEFAALSFAQPEKNQYAYQLEGFDRDWHMSGTQRFGRYTNLPGGTYTLRLKASNNDGFWNMPGTAIQITVVPPFWETWWFRSLMVLALIGGAAGGYRLRVKSIQARSRELQMQVEQRTAELKQEIAQRLRAEEALRRSELDKAISAERSRLARDLHDVVTQTLFSASLVAEALPTAWERDHAEGRQLLRELRQLTRGALAEMRTLLLELRPAALMEADLGHLLHQLAEALTGREGAPVTVTVEGRCALPPEVHLALYRIAQEAFNNVSKHARAQHVTVNLRCLPPVSEGVGEDEQGGVELRVRDDGCGFDASRVPSECLGLGIMRERAETIGATLVVESQVGHGTQISVVWEEGAA
jgi:signal transduction histidine kinase/ligand-binding sensor domain-containing protein